MKETLTHLEMRHPDHLVPAPAVDGIGLRRAAPTEEAIRRLQTEVAAPHHWKRLNWSDRQWADWLVDPRHHHHVLLHHHHPIGVAEFEEQPHGDLELTAFGLRPSCVGRGWGGHALTLTTRQAWRLTREDGLTTRRLWLYTSSLDHPHALPNYTRRGFRPFRVEARERDDLDARTLTYTHAHAHSQEDS